jgi:hypothetical protein
MVLNEEQKLLLPTTRLTALIKLSRLSFIMENNFSYVRVTTRNWFCLATNIIDTRDEASIIDALNETNETTSLKYDTHLYKGKEQNN